MSHQTPAQRKRGKVRRNKEAGAKEETSHREAITKGVRLTKAYSTTTNVSDVHIPESSHVVENMPTVNMKTWMIM